MNEPVDECDDTRSARKDLGPGGERLVRGKDDRLVLITTGNELEQEIGVLGGGSKISELVDNEHVWTAVVPKPSGKRRAGALGSEVVD